MFRNQSQVLICHFPHWGVFTTEKGRVAQISLWKKKIKIIILIITFLKKNLN